MKKIIPLLALILCAFPLSAVKFRFIQITDLHWGPREHSRRIQKAAVMIRNLPWKIDFIAVTGDLSSNNILKKGIISGIKSAFKAARLPVHYLPGNHDILKWGGNREASKKIYIKNFSPLAYTVRHKGIILAFCFMETVREKYRLRGYNAWSWLSTTLSRCRKYPVLLFHHSPPTRDFYYAGTTPKNKDPWGQKNRDRYRRTVNRFKNVKGIFCGHFHRDDLHRIGSVPLFSAPSIAGYWGRQASFRVYTYDNGNLEYLTVYVQ